MSEDRLQLLNDLVNEVTKDEYDAQMVQTLAEKLHIPFSEDPLQLLNNILKGIHTEGPKNESNA
jgi:hypothetical protein